MKSTIETPAIQRFMKLVQTASTARSKDIRLEAQEATALSAEIGLILARLSTNLSQKVDTSDVLEINISGGTF